MNREQLHRILAFAAFFWRALTPFVLWSFGWCEWQGASALTIQVQKVEEFRQAVRENSRSAQAYDSLATALDRARQFDDSVRAYEMAVELDPNYVPAELNLEIRAIGTGLLEDAGDHCAKVVGDVQ